jgi:hypothetical protein
MGKPVSLLASVRASKAPAPVAPEPGRAENEAVKHVMLRLNTAAHDVLRELSFTQRRPQSALLIEALNDLFTKHGKPPIAG